MLGLADSISMLGLESTLILGLGSVFQSAVGLTEEEPAIELLEEPAPTPLRRSSRVRKPPDMYGFTSPLSLTTTLSYVSIPSSYKQEMENDCWQKAIETELLALEENQTWDVVPCPPSIKPLGSKFVFSIKFRWIHRLLQGSLGCSWK